MDHFEKENSFVYLIVLEHYTQVNKVQALKMESAQFVQHMNVLVENDVLLSQQAKLRL